MEKCPYCGKDIQEDDLVCPHCMRVQVEKLTLEEEYALKRPYVLNEAIGNYLLGGWILLNKSDGTAQLKKPKRFNWVLFIVGILLGLIIGVIYLIVYALKKDELVTLTTDFQGNLIINGVVQQPAGQMPPEEKEK